MEKDMNLSEKKSDAVHRTVIIEWITIITAIIACFTVQFTQIQNLDAKIEKQSQRTDRLYEIIIDILKLNKC